MDKNLVRQLNIELIRCKELIVTEIFIDVDSPFRQSAYIELLIRLNDILLKLHLSKNRIDFKDDVTIQEGVKDITDLIKYHRDAACHVFIPKNYLKNNTKFVFNTISGKAPNAFCIGQIHLGCEYSDDIAFYYGDKRIYYKRHILRLINEIEAQINNGIT